jgi:hypothetical protein
MPSLLPPSNPYTFLIQSTATTITADEAATLMRLVNATKNLRSHYVVETEIAVNGTVFMGGVVMSCRTEIFYQGYAP